MSGEYGLARTERGSIWLLSKSSAARRLRIERATGVACDSRAGLHVWFLRDGALYRWKGDESRYQSEVPGAKWVCAVRDAHRVAAYGQMVCAIGRSGGVGCAPLSLDKAIDCGPIERGLAKGGHAVEFVPAPMFQICVRDESRHVRCANDYELDHFGSLRPLKGVTDVTRAFGVVRGPKVETKPNTFVSSWRAYCYESDSRVLCVDLETGKPRDIPEVTQGGARVLAAHPFLGALALQVGQELRCVGVDCPGRRNIPPGFEHAPIGMWPYWVAIGGTDGVWIGGGELTEVDATWLPFH